MEVLVNWVSYFLKFKLPFVKGKISPWRNETFEIQSFVKFYWTYEFFGSQILTCFKFRQEKVEKEAKEANSEPENLARKPQLADPQRLDFK